MNFDFHYGMPLPRASDRFMPKKHGPLLSRLVIEAWEMRQAELNSLEETLAVAETLLAWLEARNPAQDMEVLRRYGKTQEVEHAYVRAYDPASKRWDQNFSVALPRKIEVAAGAGNDASVCGVRWSRVGGRGLKRESMTPEDYERAVAYQDDHERGMAPESLDPYFAALVEARRAYRAEYRASTEWPAVARKETGVYPLWREIEERFPVLGAHVARIRAPVDVPLAAVAD